MAEALLGKAAKAAGAEEALRLCSQALGYSGEQKLTDRVLRRRIDLLPRAGRYRAQPSYYW